MGTNVAPFLVIGKIEFVHTGELIAQGLVVLRIAGVEIRVRKNSRVLNYLVKGRRYIIAYTENGFACTLTVIKPNPKLLDWFRLQERQRNGSLPTREVWKKAKPRNPMM